MGTAVPAPRGSQTANDEDGDIWLRIQLPIWPNGQEGWVAASDVRLAEAEERVVVDLSERRLVRLREGEPVARVEVAVGSAATPTPPGRYFVWAKVQPNRPSGPYGSFILGLSGFSESIEPWKEWPGEPRLAIHGTDDPTDAGHAVSKGCVRVLNSLLRDPPRRPDGHARRHPTVDRARVPNLTRVPCAAYFTKQLFNWEVE